MNITKRIIAFLIAIVTCFALVSCNGAGANDGGSTSTSFDENAGQNEVADLTSTYDSIAEATSAVYDSLNEDAENTSAPEGAQTVYAISEAGDYSFSGALNGAITVAKNLGNVHIYLENATVTVTDDNVTSAKAGSYRTITLIGKNNLSNVLGGKAKDKHVIDAKENLVINGEGSLVIDSTKSGIATDKTFFGLGGSVTVTAVKHAVTADSVYIDGLNINAAYCGKDVIHAESDYDEVESAPQFDFNAGYVCIVSGGITTQTVLGDVIQADSFVRIQGGTFDFTTTPTWNDAYVATQNEESGLYNVSNHQKVSRDSVRAGSTYAALEESVKGIKVGEIDYYLATDTEQANELTVESDAYTILIEGGTFVINTVDDAIHTNSGSVMISGGNFTITTSDDAIHADTNLKISGSAEINIVNCYEGIEAETVEITGGNTTIVALDDGVNATNSNLTESEQSKICQINISGGRLDVTVNPSGDRDGIDSNGGIKMTGGVVITRGPNSQMASPIDAANAVSVTGGTLVIIGNAPSSGSSGGGMRPGMGGPGFGGGMEGSFSTSLTKTQSSNKGLSKGEHTVTVGGTTISYYNAYAYSGYTTVFASASATIN